MYSQEEPALARYVNNGMKIFNIAVYADFLICYFYFKLVIKDLYTAIQIFKNIWEACSKEDFHENFECFDQIFVF